MLVVDKEKVLHKGRREKNTSFAMPKWRLRLTDSAMKKYWKRGIRNRYLQYGKRKMNFMEIPPSALSWLRIRSFFSLQKIEENLQWKSADVFFSKKDINSFVCDKSFGIFWAFQCRMIYFVVWQSNNQGVFLSVFCIDWLCMQFVLWIFKAKKGLLYNVMHATSIHPGIMLKQNEILLFLLQAKQEKVMDAEYKTGKF